MFKKLISFALLGLFVSHCGVSDPGTKLPENLKKIEIPKYSYFNLNLTDSLSQHQNLIFGGSLLFWKNLQENEEALANVLGFSREIKVRLAQKKKLELYEKKLRHKIASLKEKLDEKASKNCLNYFSSLDLGQITNLLSILLPKSLESSEEFSSYCVAKGIEYSTSSLATEGEYSTRPSPSLLCENYYKNNNLYEGRFCEKTSLPENRLSCFWTPEFFVKSGLKLFEKTAEGTFEIKEDKLLSKEFSKIWHSVDWSQELSSKRAIILNGMFKLNNNFIYIQKNDEKFKSKEHLLLNLGENLVKASSPELRNMKGELFSLLDLIDQVHHISKERSEEIYVLEKKGQENLETITKLMPSLFPEAYKPFDTENDPLSSELLEQQSLLNEIEKHDSEHKKNIEKIDHKFNVAKNKFDDVLFKNNLMHSYFPSMELNFEKKSNGGLKLHWKLDNISGTKSYSCELEKEKSSRLSEEEEEDKNSKIQTCTFDKNTGKLTLIFTGDSLQDSGWSENKKEIPGEKFNTIDKKQLLGTTFIMDLDYIDYREVIPMFTGEAFVKKDGKTLFHGSVLLRVP